jgi:hypothetical protein
VCLLLLACESRKDAFIATAWLISGLHLRDFSDRLRSLLARRG